METAKDLIAQSIRYNEITHAPYAPELCDEMLVECEDHVDSNSGVVEFWGTDDDGDTWRVHLDLSEDS